MYMALPKPIQDQIDRAEATLASYGTPAEAPPNQPEADAVVVAEPQEVKPPVVAEKPQPKPPTVQDESVWENKFKALQGIFNKEVPALQGQVKNLTAQLTQVQQTLEQVKAEKQRPQEIAQPTADPKDVDNFGEDLVSMVARIADQRFGSVAQSVQSKLSELQTVISSMEQRLEGTSQTVAVTSEQSFFDKLAKAVPEWESTNSDPAFLQWLGESDPVYGVPRQKALEAARNNLDAQQVANVFKAFAPTPVEVAPPVANKVDRQVSPRAGANAGAPTQQAAEMYTQRQITDFYNDIARGRFRGREQEANAIEQAVNKAIAEGRVR
jgi:prefoldin subunit 5